MKRVAGVESALSTLGVRILNLYPIGLGLTWISIINSTGCMESEGEGWDLI